jgi:hypothetical protein
VIPQALGGRLKSKTICCTGCNNAISEIENDLCTALRELSAALGARNADNQPIHAEVEANGKTYDYSEGVGEQQLPQPKYDGRALTFPLPGGVEQQAEEIAKRLWTAGLSPKALDDGTFRIVPDSFGIQPHPPATTMLNLKTALGTTAHMRVVMKIALEYLAYVYPTEARRWSELRKARRYIRWSEGVDTFPARFEALSQGSGVLNPNDLPLLAHAVEVWTHRRNVHYRVTLFGRLHVTGSLTTDWSGAAFTLAHAFDPTQPGKRLDGRTDSDGPPLGVYHADLNQQAFAQFQAWFLERTLDVSKKVTGRPWDPPGAPDLTTLRPLIEMKFERLRTRRKQPKPRKKR